MVAPAPPLPIRQVAVFVHPTTAAIAGSLYTFADTSQVNVTAPVAPPTTPKGSGPKGNQVAPGDGPAPPKGRAPKGNQVAPGGGRPAAPASTSQGDSAPWERHSPGEAEPEIVPLTGQSASPPARRRFVHPPRPVQGGLVPHTAVDYGALETVAGGDLDALFQQLSGLGFGLPQDHLRAFLDWSHTEKLQVGLHYQHPDELARTATHDACRLGGAEGLTWQRVHQRLFAFQDIASNLQTLSDRGIDPSELEVADRLVPLELNPKRGPDDVIEIKSALCDTETFLRDRLAPLVDVFLKVLVAMRPDLWGTEPETARFLTVMQDPMMQGHVRSGNLELEKALVDGKQPTGSQIAGFAGVWKEIVVRDRKTGTPVLGPVRIPVGLMKSDGSWHDFQTSGIPTDTAKTPLLTAAGYRLYRLAPITTKGEPDHAQQLARRDIQIKRDFKLLEARFVKLLTPKADDSAIKRSYRLFADPMADEAGEITDGAFLITPTVKSGRADIHVMRRPFMDPELHKYLIDLQDKARHKHTLALSAVSFIAGQLYSKPTYSLSEKYWESLFKNGLRRKLKAGIAASIVVASVGLFAAPVVIAGVAAGVFIIKRLWINEKIDAPEDLLKDPNLLALSANDLTDDEKKKFNAYLKKTDDDDEKDQEAAVKAAETQGKPGWVARIKAKISSKTKEQTDAEKRGIEALVDHNLTLEHNVGNLLRRSFVHFRFAHEAVAIIEGYGERRHDDSYRKAVGEAMHHLEKGWRYLAPSIMFLGVAWDQQRQATSHWKEHSYVATQIMMNDFLQIYEDSHYEINRAGLTTIFNEVLRNNKLGLAWKWVKRGVNSAGVWAHFSLKSEKREAVFNEQLAAFLYHAFPAERAETEKAFPKIAAQSAEMIGGPELYAEWQLRDGYLEPYQPRTESSRNKKRGATDPRDGMRFLIEKFQTIGVDTLRKDIYRRVSLFHQVAKEVKLPSAAFYAGNGEQTALTREISSSIDRGGMAADWETANTLVGWYRYKRLTHSMRNWYRRRSWREKAMTSITVGADMVLGVWSAIAFGNLDLGMSYKPERLDLGLKMDKKSLAGNIGDSGLWGNKISDAATKVGVSTGFTAASLVLENAINDKADERLSYTVLGNGILSKAGRERSLVNNMANPTTPPQELSEDGLEALETQDPAAGAAVQTAPAPDDVSDQPSPQEMKKIATYIGANLLNDIAESITASRHSIEKFAKLQGEGFPLPANEGLEHLTKGMLTTTAFRALKWRIQPLAEYYAGMDQLDASLNNFLTYLEMHRNWGITVERKLFKKLVPKDDHDRDEDKEYLDFHAGKHDVAMGLNKSTGAAVSGGRT